MSLTIISRPQKSLYVNEPVQVYDEPYYTSFWVAAHLPCVYRIESNLWPNNRQDLISNFNGTYNYAGNAAIDLTTGFYTIYKLGDYITIKSSTLAAYVGTWRVIGFAAPDIPILDMPFVGNAGGVAVKYYNNYSIEVEVYTGFDSAEPNSSVRPMQLRATLKLLPDTNNIATVDVSKIVQADFSPFKADESIAGYPNDRNHWTQFYIRYRERYNTPALDGTPELFEGGWQVDTVSESCNDGEVIINSSFDFGTITDSGAELNTFSGLLQAGTVYEIQMTFTLSGGEVRFIVRGQTSGYNYLYEFRSSSGTITVNFDFVINESGLILEVLSTSSTILNVTNFDVTQISGCTAILNASNSVLQPRATYGSNMGKYVLHNNGEQFANKFLDDQTATTYFDGLPFTFDFILSAQAALLASAYSVPIKLVNPENKVLTQFSPNGQGLYRIPLALTEADCVQAQIIPPNSITFADLGTFEANDTGVSTTNGGASTGRSSDQAYEGSFSYAVAAASEDFFDTPIVVNFPVTPLVQGQQYQYSCWVKYTGQNIGLGTAGSIVSPISLVVDDGVDTYQSNSLIISDPLGNTSWVQLSVIFTPQANSVTASITLQGLISIPISNIKLLYIDSVVLAGPLLRLSESKCISFNNQCSPYGTYLKWLNPLGGYRYWYFKGAQSSTVEPSEGTEIKRNIYGNWDEDFIAADTERDYISGGGNEVITLRSDTLTKEQADLVATIMNSTKVYRYISTMWETVLVQKGSLAKYSQRDKLVSLSVDIMPTFDILSQEQ